MNARELVPQIVGLFYLLSLPCWAASRELLANGGFEAETNAEGLPPGWTFVEGKVALTSQRVHSGQRALEAQDLGERDSVSVDSLHAPCDENQYYVARVWFRPEGTARPWIYLQFFTEHQHRLSFFCKAAPPSTDWVRLSVAAACPKGARFVSVLLFSGAAERGRFQVDDVSLTEWSSEDLGGRSGALPNPGFETLDPVDNLPAGYEEVSGSVSLTGDNPHAGAKALLLKPQEGEAGPPQLRSLRIPAKPGQRWLARGWTRQTGGAAGRITLEFWDSFLTRLAVFDTTPGTAELWEEAHTEGIAPEKTAAVALLLSTTAEAKGSACMDDLTLNRIPMEGPEVVDIGTYRQLFIDDFLIDEMEDLERVFHQAVKEPKPALVADKPWEKPAFLGVLGNCVFYDAEEKLYKMFYVIYQLIGRSERQHVALATSKDGLHWDKPNLGHADYKGAKQNNLLWDFDSPRYGKDWWTYNNIIKDARDPDPSRRYKALGMWMRFDEKGKHVGYGMLVAFSSDGLHWTEPKENPVLPNGDTHTLLGWDDAIGKYVAYPRTGVPGCGRCIGYSTSDDFLRWTEAKTVMQPEPGDPPHYQIYGMPVFKYGGLYLGLPWAFIEAGTEPLDTQLAVSRDGVKWQKVAGGQKFVPRGPAGAFDDSYAICAAPVQVGDELFFYYMGCGFPHGPQFVKESKLEGSIGLARLRLDGFVSLSCSMDSGGMLTTRPVRFTGKRLVVNCNCPNGWLRVELTDEEGKVLPGFTESDCDRISADSVRHIITWKGRSDVSSLAGKPMRVKIRLGDGEIFSFGFTE